MGKVFEYIQMSNEYEQQILFIEDFKKTNNIYNSIIFIEKTSSKSINDREELQLLLKVISKDDLLIINSIDMLSKNYKECRKIWKEIINRGADIIVLDIQLDTRQHKEVLGDFISDLFLNILNYFIAKEDNFRKQRQREGYDTLQKNKDGKLLTKDGTKVVGRPSIDYPDNWEAVYNEWKENKITATKAMELLQLKRNTFYRLAQKYQLTKEAEEVETTEEI